MISQSVINPPQNTKTHHFGRFSEGLVKLIGFEPTTPTLSR